MRGSFDRSIIFFVMFATGLASLIYEVVLISMVTTVVGASEISLSIVLGAFLGGLAIGALIGGRIIASKKEVKSLILMLIAIECGVSLFGFGFLSFLSHFVSSGIETHVIFLIILFGLFIPTILMGMEIPIAVSILERRGQKQSTGFVYFSDTLGGVLGSLASGTLLIPILGFHGAMYFGALLNIFTCILASRLLGRWRWFIPTLAVIAGLVVVLFFSTSTLDEWRLRFMDSFFGVGSTYYAIYYTTPVFSVQSPYQHIAILDSPYYGMQLMLDGQYQISDRASLQYHEYLTMPAIAAHPNPKRVLLIGGGDGGALYQLLKFNFTTIDHVDLDKEVIDVSEKYLEGVNHGSLSDKRITRHITDGRQFLKKAKKQSYDIIIVDLPDPSSLALAPLYSQEFYKEVYRVLDDKGIVVTQFTPPYYYLEGFTSQYRTIKSVFPLTFPYVIPGSLHGSLGFIIAGKSADPRKVSNPSVFGKWYDKDTHGTMFNLPPYIDDYLKDSPIQITTDENPMIHVYMQTNYFYRGVADD